MVSAVVAAHYALSCVASPAANIGKKKRRNAASSISGERPAHMHPRLRGESLCLPMKPSTK